MNEDDKAKLYAEQDAEVERAAADGEANKWHLIDVEVDEAMLCLQQLAPNCTVERGCPDEVRGGLFYRPPGGHRGIIQAVFACAKHLPKVDAWVLELRPELVPSGVTTVFDGADADELDGANAAMPLAPAVEE